MPHSHSRPNFGTRIHRRRDLPMLPPFGRTRRMARHGFASGAMMAFAQAESQALRDAIVATAEQEWERWDRGTMVETDRRAQPILANYYRDGVGERPGDRLGDPTWHGSNANPWSAVFVSWVMQSAGAGTDFRYSRAHHYYIAAAKRNRMRSRTENPFWAYRITEVAPQPGDIVCNTRAGSGATFDNIHDTSTFRSTHGDIVTEVLSDRIVVVGGNTSQRHPSRGARGNTVGKKTIRIDGRGFIRQRGTNPFFAIVRVRDAGGATPPPAPGGKSFRHSRFRGERRPRTHSCEPGGHGIRGQGSRS